MTPPRGYLIAGMPRSGTNLLSEVLTDSGRAGHPDEWYGPSRLHARLLDWGLAHPGSTAQLARATSWEAYRTRLFDTSSTDGHFGMKLFPYQAEPLIRSGQVDDLLELVPERCRSRLQVIHVHREDVVAQAVSVAVAHRTGVYVKGSVPIATTIHFWETGPDGPSRTTDDGGGGDGYAPEWIDRIVAAIKREQRLLDSWTTRHRLPVLRISYEDLVERREPTLAEVFGFLGLSRHVQFPPPRIERQAGPLNATVAARYRAWAATVPQDHAPASAG